MNSVLSLHRMAPWAGILFIVLFFISFLLPGEMPCCEDPDSEVVAFYEDSGKQTSIIASAYLLTIAGLAFLVFLLGLRDRLAQAEGQPETLSRLALVGGVLFVAMLFVFVVSNAAVAAGTAFQDEPVDAGFARFIPHLGFGALLLPGMGSAILLILATSTLSLRTGVLPAWSAWLGFVAAIALLFAVVFLPAIAFFIWVLAISLVLLRNPPATPEAM